jgi:uncharacterized membrane protein (UPF0127 family)
VRLGIALRIVPPHHHVMWREVALVALMAAALAVVWGGPRLDIPSRFWLSPIESVSVGDRELRVVRVGYAQGLRDVESLGALDGALFVLDQTAGTDAGMGMYDTRIPLDVVFFDSTGRFIDRFTMPVCSGEICPTFYPSRPWLFAIEAPAGSLSWIGEGAKLDR